MSVLGAHLYQCTSWWCCESLCLALVNFFLEDFQCICPFHGGWFTHTPAHTTLSVQQFLTKNGMTPMPYLPYLPELTLSNFFCFPRRKSPQRETFCQCGRGETKNGRSTKRHQNWCVQKLFWAVEKRLDRCIASTGECFEGDWHLNIWINTQFFIKKNSGFFGSPFKS